MDFDAWFDEFFRQYDQLRPVNASFLGHHIYDSLLPEVSASALQAAQHEMTALLRSADAIDASRLTPLQQMDLRVARGFLETQLWEYGSGFLYNRNPSYYTGEAIFGIIALFLTDYAPLEERVQAAVKRMQAIPSFLEQAQANLSSAPQAWTERALDECKGAAALFGDGLPRLAVESDISDPAFLEAARQAELAFARFAEFLQNDLLANASQDYACGAEAMDLMLQKAHFFPQSAAELDAYASREMAEADRELRARASEFGAATPEEALAKLADLHPTAEEYYASYAYTWQECQACAQENQLVTWPDFPIRYVPRPAWVRSAAPHLYFLFYRAPASVNRPAVHEYLVSPLPAENVEAFLRANNDSSIKLNHVVHHGSIGHHVQNWNAYHSQSRIGQVAAVDTASRIAMLNGGTMAEGWACYATDLMAEVGFLTPLEEYSELQSRRRMCARAIVDLRLHRGEFTFDQAVQFYQDQAGMSAASARSEVTKNSMFPGGAVMYLFGRDGIYQLRELLKSKEGAEFSLCAFHDEFLSYGSLPVSLISQDMQRKRNDAQR